MHRAFGDSHTYVPGECRFSAQHPRLSGSTGRGARPRPPAEPATRTPVGDLQAQLPGGADLGAGEEADLAPPPPPIVPAPPTPGGSEAVGGDGAEGPSAAEPAGAQPKSEARPRGPAGPRQVHHPRDAGVGEHASDRTRFDISASLRALRRGTPGTALRELRKLHLRWWHASSTAMTNTLKAAGLPPRILDEIPKVVQSCRECSTWTKPAPDTHTSITTPTRFSQYVEVDLMFYETWIIFHAICRATRFHAAKAVPNKMEQTLIDAVYTTWVAIHGAPEFLYVDGESGLNTDRAKAIMARDGIILKTRAPGQHARHIERAGAYLRVALHTAHSQCDREGVRTTFDVFLSMIVFAKNALVTVGGHTPYQAVFGRQPAMLPPIESPGMPDGETEDGRKEARIREIALEAMI